MAEAIFALSSGAPPAAIAVIRISGPAASDALAGLGAFLPAPRRATRRRLYEADGGLLDDALVLWLPGPGTATGEDTVELHCHGGRAIVAAVTTALSKMPGLRQAQPGEFTRRAFVNGRIDLAEAEGLADLLSAETDMQRRSALAMASGAFSRTVEGWRDRLLVTAAAVEAELDFGDEDEIGAERSCMACAVRALAADIDSYLQRPRVEALSEGFRVVIAGPPNAGKSTLFNALVGSEAAITAPIPGTTRDVLMRSVAIAGVPFVFVDTAGLREGSDDAIEVIGIARAREAAADADVVLWLGDEGSGGAKAWDIEAKTDLSGGPTKTSARHRVSALVGTGIDTLRNALVAAARETLPRPGAVALSRRQHNDLGECRDALLGAIDAIDPLLIAEQLRLAGCALDRLTGRGATEDMLDTLFARFCIGK